LDIRRRITIHELAKLCEVSATTVSHTFTGKRRVEPATRLRILKMAKELDYQPSRVAQALRSSRTGVIALILPFIEGESRHSQEFLGLDYYMKLSTAAASASMQHDYPLMLIPGSKATDDLQSLSVDGVIICDPDENDRHIQVCDAIGMPFVTIGRDIRRGEHVNYVCSDSGSNTRQMLDHMHSSGAQRITLLASKSRSSWSKESEQAYIDWCLEVGSEPVVDRASLRNPQASAKVVANTILNRKARPDGVLALEEIHGLAFIQVAQELGWRFPQDMLLAVGIDSSQARYSTPPLTAIDILPERQGAAAVEMLLSLLRGEVPTSPITIPARLNIRESTKRRD
jgi:DNA-binding LacI/PurR family transcriptional regulator